MLVMDVRPTALSGLSLMASTQYERNSCSNWLSLRMSSLERRASTPCMKLSYFAWVEIFGLSDVTVGVVSPKLIVRTVPSGTNSTEVISATMLPTVVMSVGTSTLNIPSLTSTICSISISGMVSRTASGASEENDPLMVVMSDTLAQPAKNMAANRIRYNFLIMWQRYYFSHYKK